MDPTNNTTLKHATELIRAGKQHQASVLLAKFLRGHPDSEHAWHIMSYALDDQEQRVYALKRTLQINPSNKFAKQRLYKLAPTIEKEVPLPGQQPLANNLTTAKPAGLLRQAVMSPESSKFQSLSGTDVSVIIPDFEMRQPTRTYSPLHRLLTRITINWRHFKLSWGIFAQSPLAITGLILILLFGLMAIAHPILMNTVWARNVYDPATGFDINYAPHPSAPVPGHILGTDSLGRDVLSMILAATTPTFVVGLTAALSTAFIGTTLSVIAAYFKGTIDAIITNTADVFLLFPAPIIMVIIGARFRDLTPLQLGLIYGFVTGAGGTTIVMRAQAIQIVSKPFMEAAHISGGGPWHIITKHLIPSVLPLAALQMMIAVTGAVVADGFISFFGLTRTTTNWGTIIYDAFVYGNISGAYGPPWHMLIPSAACFSLFALGFYLVSRGLHRVASPTMREDR